MGENFDTKVGEDNIIYMTLKGSIDKERIPSLKEWAEKTTQIIKDTYQKTNQKVKTVVDLSALMEKYDGDGIDVLSAFMKDNRPYINKTATFGATWVIKLAEEVIINLAGRKNVKAFENKKEALEWLME